MATSLASTLSLLLPRDFRFHVHHVVSQTTSCDPLFAPPPATKPDDTTQEHHTLSVSIDHEGALLHILALEAILYETSSLTTLFVSKADSTGYAYLQETHHPSSTRVIVCEFLRYLVNIRKREGIKFVISLFARAQDQYLFPGSIENPRKHVLDDRHLIKWWCRILNTVLRKTISKDASASNGQVPATIAQGFLKVPGCDDREVQSFFRKDRNVGENSPWTHGDPLKTFQAIPELPERCLIPRFPDDPKARFAIDLDDELPENRIPEDSVVNGNRSEIIQENGNLPIPKHPPTAEYSPSQQQPPKPQSDGKWRSVKSLDQFWELMGFRQECAAGRLVGFIWGVIDTLPSPPVQAPRAPSEVIIDSDAASQDTPQTAGSRSGLASPPLSSQVQPENHIQNTEAASKEPPTAIEEPTPSLVTPLSSQTLQAPSQIPEAPNKADPHRNNELFLLLPAYTALSNVLQTGDYSTLDLAKATTANWVETLEREIRIFGGEEAVERSRALIVGQNDTQVPDVDETTNAENGVSADGAGFKRQRQDEAEVKVLAGGLVRKKRKV